MFLTPSKTIECNVLSATGLEAWPYDGFNHDYRWMVTMTIRPQAHSDSTTREPYVYNGLDVSAGQFVASLIDGASLRIVQILNATETTLECVLEDTEIFNGLMSIGRMGIGMFPTPCNAIIFETNETGQPIIVSTPSSTFGAPFLSTVNSRFQKMDSTVLITVSNHGFSNGQIIGTFESILTATPTSDAILLGYVADVLDQDNFLLKPTGKLHYADVPGTIGQAIYLSETGDYTIADDGTIVGVKIGEGKLLFTSSSGAGGSGSGSHLRKDILESSSSTLIGKVNGTVQRIKVIVTQPFTGTVSIGTMDNNSDLASSDQIIETENGIYIIDTYKAYNKIQIYAFVNDATTNTGRATISIETDRE